MGKLGISLYPEQSTFEADKAYLERAKNYGYERLFLSLLQLDASDTEGKGFQQFLDTLTYAKYLGYEVGIDVNPHVLTQMGVDSSKLETFTEMGADIIRLDNETSAVDEARMTHNALGLSIELNMSQGTRHLDAIMSYSPDKSQLIGSHNFYPHRFSGLGLAHFNQCNAIFKQYNLRTMAFVNSQAATFGPWPMPDGLCTLEMHRTMDLVSQVKHLKLVDAIDDIVIANAYASDDELRLAAEAFNALHTTLRMVFNAEATAIEREIILNNLHSYRGDHSDYMIRSSWMRELYKTADIPAHTNQTIHAGDVIVNNSNYLRYKGEMQIALQEMPADERVNVVGHIVADDHILFENMHPWSAFQIVDVQDKE
ncbi:DUF871 domain-containing protein [Fundicoccus culcitae]|uniref:MupG family TIM beta-alpha barrel fold protein n=1 Tax=Fundicoccus culcitae TaxID=2969821 RepID=A0ABY5P9M7_9LACT|nr:MupG family TIM beta-alpha barrel fold protein [Fundicoccus culcitae]UUX35467.1 MupG family TIM beta-alpha barrel fold protein [Fundicoccus culcitae]